MIHTNQWSPDTCEGFGCTIEYQWDDANPNVKFNYNIIKTCPDHDGILSNELFYTVMLNENQRKNRIWNELKSTNWSDLVDDLGDGQFEWKPGVIITWSWSGIDEDRVLNVDLSQTPLTTNQKNQAQTWADSQFGVGKVLIVG